MLPTSVGEVNNSFSVCKFDSSSDNLLVRWTDTEKLVNETGKENIRKGAVRVFFSPKFISKGVDILWRLSSWVPAAVCVTVAFGKSFVQLLGQIVGLLSFTR